MEHVTRTVIALGVYTGGSSHPTSFNRWLVGSLVGCCGARAGGPPGLRSFSPYMARCLGIGVPILPLGGGPCISSRVSFLAWTCLSTTPNLPDDAMARCPLDWALFLVGPLSSFSLVSDGGPHHIVKKHCVY